MKRISFIVMALAISTFAIAQDKVFGGSGSFYLGVKSYDTENYQFFMPEDAPPLDNGFITIGGGGYMLYSNWLIGGYGVFRTGDRQNLAIGTGTGNQNYDYKLNGGGGYLNLGYVLFYGSSWIFFPQIGFGVESMSLEKSLTDDADFAVQQNLSAKYTWNSPMLELALGFDFFPLGSSRIKFGLRAGYHLSLNQDNEWHHEGGDYTGPDLPENYLNGFFVNLAIGGGFFIQKNMR